MKKALSLLLTLALLAGTFCTVVPMTASASAVSFTVTAGTVDAAFTGGVAVYTNTGSSDKKFPSLTYHFYKASLLVFAKDGRLIEAGGNLIEEKYCVQENLVVPAGGFAVAYSGNSQLDALKTFAMEGAMLYNATLSVTRKATGSYDPATKKVKISYDNADRTYAKDALRFLFVGNSTTYVNGCPLKFQAMAEAAGKSVIVDYCTKGSAYLTQFADASLEEGKKFRNLLSKNKYDYVVLQDAAGTTFEKAVQACDVLIPLIKANGAKPVFYMRYSDAECNPTRVNNHYNVYSALAKKYDTIYAPIVVSFYRCFQTYPEITLMADDGGHHSKEGSYLIAATWLYAFLGIDPLGNAYTADMPAETVKKLQTMAKSSIEEPFTRLDSPDTVPATYETADGNFYDLISEGKTYVCSAPYYGGTSSGGMVDKDASGNPLYKLTNGIRATEPAEGNAPGQIGAYSQAANSTLVLDLGAVSDVKAVTYDLWGITSWGVPMPSKATVTVALSEDGKTYSSESAMTYKQTYAQGTNEGGLFSYEYATLQKARYVRLTFKLAGNFLWGSEFAVYGVAAEQPPAEYPFGDVNRDRVVDAFDYQMLKAYVLGTYTAQHEEDVALMDILSDGSIDAFDYQIVKAIVLGTYKVD